MFKFTSKVDLVKEIDVSEYRWCNEAILFHVKQGKGTLTHRMSEYDKEYYMHKSQLLLNDKPLIQGKYSSSPTCEGLLATGYGIENIDSPELIKVRECMNSEYKGLKNALENIKPLLGLLDDGYYVLADAKLYPSNSEGDFFYNVPNELSVNYGTCEGYYNSGSMFSGYFESQPAYIYPTQSADLIQEDRVDYYVDILKNNNDAPRGLAFYEQGFMCALLDGHHKACAASVLGDYFRCLIIIPPTSYQFGYGGYKGEDSQVSAVNFAGITLDMDKGTLLKTYKASVKIEEFDMPLYNLTGRKFPDKYLRTYPTLKVLAAVAQNALQLDGDVFEYAKTLLSNPDNGNEERFGCLLEYLSCERKKEAYDIARYTLDHYGDNYDFKEQQWYALWVMVKQPSEESERYMIDYMANHDAHSYCWNLVNSYWD